MNMKPILFNTDMVRALQANRKTVTRRVVKPQLNAGDDDLIIHSVGGGYVTATWKPSGRLVDLKLPYYPGDVLYVREAFCNNGDYDLCPAENEKYFYKENDPFKDGEFLPGWFRGWRPSIHMPREAARIFLRVTDVRVERVQDMQPYDVAFEGFRRQRDFIALWDSTIKPADRTLYGWGANPWVFVIEFERISKEEAQL